MAGTSRQDNDPFEAEQELAFADANERLPWLESDDDEGQPGVDAGRVAAYSAVGIMALILLLGALWWFTREKSDETLIAEGGLIAAPEGPYKIKPANPGGTKVAGTGDTSFEVAEGREVEGRIAEAPSPKPSIDIKQKPEPQPSASASAAPSGIGVQVGAFSTRALAEKGWQQLTGRLSPLQGRNHRVVEGVVDSGTVFRLQALAGTVVEAEALCRSIKTAGGDCQVKR